MKSATHFFCIPLRFLLKAAAISLLAIGNANVYAVNRDETLNILYIISDNQPKAIMGTYGNPDVKTPSIDRLASEGMRFENLFAANGMCSPTRATIMTGLMPSQHGVHNWLDDHMLKDWPKDWNAIREYRSLPYSLHQRGYQTALIGKWHLGQPGVPAPGFDHWVTFSVGHTVNFWNNRVIDNGREYQVDGQHIVDFFTDRAVDYLDNVSGDKPFFLMVTYDGPYLNPPTNMGKAKNRHFKEYQDKPFDSFPRERINEDILGQITRGDPGPDYKTGYDGKHHFLFNYLRMNGDQDTRANIASQNTMVDDGVGRLLEALKRKGLDENTLVIFTTDQGNFYGQHGLWGHAITTSPSSPYDIAMNIPLIIKYPGKTLPGTQSDLLIGQYDLAPTILSLAGYGDVSFDQSPGRSFAAEVAGGRVVNWNDAVYFEQEETRAVRTRQYAYWKRLKGTGEPALFDVLEDPEQRNNLYGNPEYQQVAEALDGKLVAFFARYSNPEFDLWHGGTAKGSVARPEMFRRLYGDDWQPTSEVKPMFKEAP